MTSPGESGGQYRQLGFPELGLTCPTIRVYTSLLFRPSFPKNTSGPSPSLSSTPGRKGSIKTSAWAISVRKSRSPDLIFGFTAKERFPRDRTSPEVLWSDLSMRMTEAPQSARKSPAFEPVNEQDDEERKKLSHRRRDRGRGQRTANVFETGKFAQQSPSYLDNFDARKWARRHRNFLRKC